VRPVATRAADGRTAHDTFAAPDTVAPAPLAGLALGGGSLRVPLPARSVAIVELR
jgi:alpha-N-arabinofuranosidase